MVPPNCNQAYDQCFLQYTLKFSSVATLEFSSITTPEIDDTHQLRRVMLNRVTREPLTAAIAIYIRTSGRLVLGTASLRQGQILFLPLCSAVS
jgi:hypothetical protein